MLFGSYESIVSCNKKRNYLLQKIASIVPHSFKLHRKALCLLYGYTGKLTRKVCFALHSFTGRLFAYSTASREGSQGKNTGK
jgi:hypothetical protein